MYRIITLDDESFIWNHVKASINWNEYNMETPIVFNNSLKALEYIKNNVVDGVFLDIKMPLMNGIEFSENLYVKFPNIPIYVVSAYDRFDYAQKLFKYNVVGYMVKPITRQKLNNACLELKEYIIKSKKKFSAPNNVQFGTASPPILHQYFSNLEKNINNEELINKINTTIFNNDKDTDLRQLPFANISINISNFSDEANNPLFSNIENLHNAFTNLTISNSLYVLPISYTYEKTSAFALSKTKSVTDFVNELSEFQTNFHKNCIEYLGIEVNTKIEKLYINSSDFMHANQMTPEIDELLQNIFKANVTTAMQELMELISRYKGNTDFLKFLAHTVYIEAVNRFGSDNLTNLGIIPQDFLALINQELKDIEASRITQSVIVTMHNIATFLSSYTPNSNDIISKAKLYINNHYTDNLCIEKISSMFFISTSHFSRKFKSETGISFLTYVNKIRLNSACTLLVSTNKSINEISEDVGYVNFSYFCKKFKTVIGCTAAEFRNKYVNRNKD